MQNQNYRYSVLTLSLLMLGISTATSANSDVNAEVAQLRAELKELKALVQQQAQQVQTQSQVTQHTAEMQQKLTDQVTQAKNSAASLKTATGSEFKLYGNVRADVSYQSEGGGPAHPYNQMNRVPLKGVAENSDQFKSTLSATRLGFDFKTPVSEGNVTGKVEVDFLGGANLDNLRIRHAYLNYGNWLVGQTWSNFAVPDYMPETIDALGYVGGAVKRGPQIRYNYSLQPSTHLVVALEDPKDSSINLRLPALTARLNQSFSDNAGTFSLRGLVNEKKTANDEVTAWGVGAGVKYNLTPQTTFKADYYHVKGDSAFVSWANAGIVKNAAQDIVAENEFDSITIGLTQQFHPQWRGTLAYGYMKADVDTDYKQSGVDLTTVNKELWQAWGNVFYSPTKPISLGLEYVYGERESVGKAANGSNKGEDNRINAVAIYNF